MGGNSRVSSHWSGSQPRGLSQTAIKSEDQTDQPINPKKKNFGGIRGGRTAAKEGGTLGPRVGQITQQIIRKRKGEILSKVRQA